MLTKKNSERDIPPWVDSPYNTFDKPLPPPGWSSGPINNFDKRTGKERRFGKARNQARGFLGAHGCQTSQMGDLCRSDFALQHGLIGVHK
jgi:hypothetical protein